MGEKEELEKDIETLRARLENAEKRLWEINTKSGVKHGWKKIRKLLLTHQKFQRVLIEGAGTINFWCSTDADAKLEIT